MSILVDILGTLSICTCICRNLQFRIQVGRWDVLKIEAADVPRLHVAVAMYADLFIMLVQGEDRLQGRRRETHIGLDYLLEFIRQCM